MGAAPLEPASRIPPLGPSRIPPLGPSRIPPLGPSRIAPLGPSRIVPLRAIASTATPRLDVGILHVWLADLRRVGDAALELLDAGERARMRRFAQPRKGLLWARSRGVARALLAGYERCEPRMLHLRRVPRGKPYAVVAEPRGAVTGTRTVVNSGRPDPARVRFNVSHSGTLALYAFCLDAEVGVDIEIQRGAHARRTLAARAFGGAAAAHLHALEPHAAEREFLRLWVRHEAQLKCTGAGLAGASVPREPLPWLAELDLGRYAPPPRGALAAVACEREPRELSAAWLPAGAYGGGGARD
jgi:phosphopantetheinyl transferase